MEDLKKKLLISQIEGLWQNVIDKTPSFTFPIKLSELNSLSLEELREVQRTLHEIAYAPPPRR